MLLQIKTKYLSLPVSVKASLWFVVCNILQNGISFISTPIFSRLLTAEQYGIYTVYQSWYNIIAIFATLNLYCGVFNNGLTKFPTRKQEFISSMQGLSTTVTIGLFFIYCVFYRSWNSFLKLDSLYVLLIFIQLLFVPAYQFWSVAQRYEYRYKSLVVVTLAIALLSPVIGIIAVLNTQYKAEARVLSYVLVQIAFGLIIYIFNMHRGKKFFIKEFWLYALKFNIPLIPHYLSQIVLQQSDRIMISNMVGTGQAAIYSVAYTLSTLMIIVTNAINNSFVPYSYQCLKKEKYNDLKQNATLLLILVAVCCSVTAFIGPELIAILAPIEYREAIWIIPPVAASVYFMFLYNIFGNVEFYFEQTKFTMVASCLAAILNICLNYIFINLYGYIAAGYTTMICYIIYAIAHGMLCRKISNEKAKVSQIYDMKKIIIISTGFSLIMLLVNLLYLHTAIRYFLIIAILICCIVFKKPLINILNQIRNMKQAAKEDS